MSDLSDVSDVSDVTNQTDQTVVRAARDRAPRRARLAVLLAVLVAVVACASGATPTAPVAPITPAGWTLSWSDEFTGAAGTAPAADRWTAETGGDGWGNQELEYYTASPANAALDGDGHLVISALPLPLTSSLGCWYGPCRYTSARLITKGKFTQAYGRFEARIQIPRGQGIWPAFWMLGDDIDRVGWPRSGEIDVMENIGREPRTTYGTVHMPGGSVGGADTLAAGALADDFHVFATEWEPGEVRMFVDGRLYRRITPASLPAGATWVFDHPYFLLLNVAVGGQWPGSPDATSTFPQHMIVDYVRAYRR